MMPADERTFRLSGVGGELTSHFSDAVSFELVANKTFTSIWSVASKQRR